MDAIFPEIKTPWRYPNAGCMCGQAKACHDFLLKLMQDFPEGGNDQKDQALRNAGVSNAGG
eukprot:541848-Amphidinium_carterae.1